MRAVRNIFDGRTIWDVAREAGHAARVKLGLDYRMPGGRALPAYSLAWWLTERCNLRCRMCWVKSRPKPELTPAVWLALIDQVARWRPRITITGGEPSMYRGLMTVRSGHRCNTNSLLQWINSLRSRFGSNRRCHGWLCQHAKDGGLIVQFGTGSPRDVLEIFAARHLTEGPSHLSASRRK